VASKRGYRSLQRRNSFLRPELTGAETFDPFVDLVMFSFECRSQRSHFHVHQPSGVPEVFRYRPTLTGPGAVGSTADKAADPVVYGLKPIVTDYRLRGAHELPAGPARLSRNRHL
jgi:hypothetical protein